MTGKKRTGYERVEKGEDFFRVLFDGMVAGDTDDHFGRDNACFENGNYYSDRTVAENNARADKLMRQLRRFAVEHREKNLTWVDNANGNWYIYFDHTTCRIMGGKHMVCQTLNTPYFSSVDEVRAAIEAFRDELMWYFTEYKDSL